MIRRYWMLGSFEPSEGISSFTEDGSLQLDNPGTFPESRSAPTTEFFNFRHFNPGKERERREETKLVLLGPLFTISFKT